MKYLQKLLINFLIILLFFNLFLVSEEKNINFKILNSNNISVEPNKIIMTGNVLLLINEYFFKADFVSYDKITTELNFVGNLYIKKENKVLQGDFGNYFNNTKTAKIYQNVVFRDSLVKVISDSLFYDFNLEKLETRNSNGIYYSKKNYKFKGNQIIYDSKNKICNAIGNVKVSTINDSSEIIITSSYFRGVQKDSLISFWGNVEAIDSLKQIKLNSDFLDYYSKTDSINAKGRVITVWKDKNYFKSDYFIVKLDNNDKIRYMKSPEKSEVFFISEEDTTNIKKYQNKIYSDNVFIEFNKGDIRKIFFSGNVFYDIGKYEKENLLSQNNLEGDKLIFFITSNKIDLVEVNNLKKGIYKE